MEDLKRCCCGESSLPLGAEGRCSDTAEQGAKALASEAECIVDRGEESLRLTLVEGTCLELLPIAWRMRASCWSGCIVVDAIVMMG